MSNHQSIWNPTKEFLKSSNVQNFLDYVNARYQKHFTTYDELHQWSIEDVGLFWKSIMSFFDIAYDGTYSSVISDDSMPNVQWFKGVQLNYVEHMFQNATDAYPALITFSENRERKEISWEVLQSKVAGYYKAFRSVGLKRGDTVAAFIPNIEEATYAFMACCAMGAIWSSCSPDFGVSSVLDRFQQIQPKIFIGCNGYVYNGKNYEKGDTCRQILAALPSVKQAYMVPYLTDVDIPDGFMSTDRIRPVDEAIRFARVDFSAPLWILYSSGTTGKPKAITHGHGGMLLEHKKYMYIHNDVRVGERFFWYSTTGWMMWNFLHASLLVGGTAVLYDGSPAVPNLETLWKVADEIGLHHFGTSAPYLVACMKRSLDIKAKYKLENLRSIGSTGAPLPPEGFKYVADSIKENIWLCSMAGGTDICTAWVGSIPMKPVHIGSIQCITLGTDMEAWDDAGEPVTNELGEMIVKQPLPCMPIYFWNDDEKKRYFDAYFSYFPDVWRHGDWIKIDNAGEVVILGRSDATLNRQGVRIGTAEIYRNLNDIEEIEDAIIINIEKSNGDHFMPLFIQLRTGFSMTEEIQARIKKMLKTRCTPRHVPDAIYAVPEIPLTISGKKMEAPVKKIIMGMVEEASFNTDAMKNPSSIQWYFNFAKTI